MTLAPRLRATLLAVGLALTVAAIGWVESRDEPADATRANAGPAAPKRTAARADDAKGPDGARRAAPAEAQVPAGPAPAVDLTRARRALQPLAADAFAPQSWAPPPRKLSAVERAAAEQQALGRATNWAFLMVLAGVGLTLRVSTLRQLGWRPLLAALLGWAAATAVMLGCVLAAP